MLLSNNADFDGEPVISVEADGPWGTVEAYENDIIEYNGAEWIVSFNSSEVTVSQYVVNLSDSQHYRFDGEQWVYTYLAEYNPGYWKISIN